MNTDRFEFKRDPDNGCLIGPNECRYDTKQEAMYFSLGLCGCGRPEDVHLFLLSCLAAKDVNYNNLIDHKIIIELILKNPDVVAEFILHFLDSVGLTEHGGSVYSSRLTDRGMQFLEIGAEGDPDE